MGVQEEILYRNVDVRSSGRSVGKPTTASERSGFKRKPSRAKDHGHLGVTGLQHFLGLENSSNNHDDSSGSEPPSSKHEGSETHMSQTNNDVNIDDSARHVLNEGASSLPHKDAYKTYPVYRETNLDDITSSRSPLTDNEKAAVTVDTTS